MSRLFATWSATSAKADYVYYCFSFPKKKSILLINTLTKHAMLLFFIILPEQQGYRDNSCWLPPFPLRRVLSAILKKSRHKQSSARSFPVVSDFFFHVISGRFRSFPVVSGITRHPSHGRSRLD